MQVLRLIGLSFAVMALAACGSEMIVQKLTERDANEILELLDDANVAAHKGMVDTGREVYFNISVPANQRIKAIKTLNRYNLPRPKDKGYNEVFGAESGGLIPTNTEERAKMLQAIEGEIQGALKLVNGVLDAQVNVVIPEDDALKSSRDIQALPTASVTIKYLPTPTGSKPLSEPQVQAIVAAAVERLTPDRVVVVMTPGGHATGGDDVKAVAAGPISSKQLLVLGAIVGFVVLILGIGLIYQNARLRNVRGRFIRLQNEIAKAKRKPGESGISAIPQPPGAPGA